MSDFVAKRHAVHVEVCFRKNEQVKAKHDILENLLRQFLFQNKISFNTAVLLSPKEENDLCAVESIFVEGSNSAREFVSENDAENLVFYMYYPNERVMELESFDPDSNGEPAESVPASNHWLLPCRAFVGLWENLIYEDNLKEKILSFALSALTFAQHNINMNIISCNRLILLHGPPGTGKTSFCKAIAQKLSIRARHMYRHTHLIEVNSHSLFSKWFSESGKLVMNLFSKIHDLVADANNLVCVLIDEVESLAYSRNSMSSQEPRDAMRVVNALLTQLDAIKEHPNVLILATSNLADTIDDAFLDRADIKQYIGFPGVAVIRQIYQSMLLEMIRVGIVREQSLSDDDHHEGLINVLAERSIGLSGRALRKLPYLAHASHISEALCGSDQKIDLNIFLDAMLNALQQQQTDLNSING